MTKDSLKSLRRSSFTCRLCKLSKSLQNGEDYASTYSKPVLEDQRIDRIGIFKANFARLTYLNSMLTLELGLTQVPAKFLIVHS